MDLIINGTAIVRSSKGARRYYDGIVTRLDWPKSVETTRLPRWRRAERLSEMLQRGRKDAIFWSPSHRGPLFAHHHVMTVLDCINVEYTYKDDWRLPLFRCFFQLTLQHTAKIVAISNATRAAILRNFDVDERKVIAIPGPITFSEFEPSSDIHADLASRDDRPFVLMITNALPHKNTARALEALALSDAARKGIELRIIGSADEASLESCRRAGVQVQIAQGLTDATLGAWMRHCLFLFSPSLEEGLNLPVAEALSMRRPVLCSDIAVHREFYEGRVSWCDPLRVDAMVQALNDAFEHRGNLPSGSIHRADIKFDDVAAAYRSLFAELAAERAVRAPAQG